MQDLNDLFYFTQVVERGSFTKAALTLGVPKSRLSRRIADLEEALGVRLLQRSTRHLALTEVGRVFYQHCQAMVTEAQAAHESVEHIQAEPRGRIRVSCPIILAQTVLSPILADFLQAYPHVQVQLVALNRPVDLVQEGIDLAIRARATLEDSNLVLRTLGNIQRVLVAGPGLLNRQKRPLTPDDLQHMDSLAMEAQVGRQVWLLTGPSGKVLEVVHSPRLETDEMLVLKQAAMQDLGVAMLPEYLCRKEIQNGSLEVVLPDWKLQQDCVHAIFPTRRGLLPAVRRFIDFVAEKFPSMVD